MEAVHCHFRGAGSRRGREPRDAPADRRRHGAPSSDDGSSGRPLSKLKCARFRDGRCRMPRCAPENGERDVVLFEDRDSDEAWVRLDTVLDSSLRRPWQDDRRENDHGGAECFRGHRRMRFSRGEMQGATDTALILQWRSDSRSRRGIRRSRGERSSANVPREPLSAQECLERPRTASLQLGRIRG